jgi:hypothetical protein
MKTYGEVEVCLHSFLISAVDGYEWSALRSGCFTPSTYRGKSLGGSQSRSGSCEERYTYLDWEVNSGLLVRSYLLYWLRYPAPRSHAL